MIIKETFSLLPGKENLLNLAQIDINKASIPYGIRKSYSFLKGETKIVHYGKEKILSLLLSQKGKPLFAVVNLPNYYFPVSYNRKTDQIIINIASFGTDDITPTNPDPRNLYSCYLYGYTFYNLIKGTLEVNKKIAPSIISFLTAVLIRLFGKDYGLLSSYSYEIPKLKFLLSCYILKSFFGTPDEDLYKYSAAIATFDYRPYEVELSDFDFSDIIELVQSFSELRVMPGINNHVFAKKFYSFFGVNFLPALEDGNRFVSILSTATVSGTTIVPTFIASKYNKEAFLNIIKISKTLFV